jgi:hypothetical protein
MYEHIDNLPSSAESREENINLKDTNGDNEEIGSEPPEVDDPSLETKSEKRKREVSDPKPLERWGRKKRMIEEESSSITSVKIDENKECICSTTLQRPQRKSQKSNVYKEYICDGYSKSRCATTEIKSKSVKGSSEVKKKKRELKSNYDGREDLGIIVDSNIFPDDRFYGSTTEALLTNIYKHIQYVYNEDISLDVETKWMPILTNIKLILEIIVGKTPFEERLSHINELGRKL